MDRSLLINIRSKEDEKACANKKKKFNTKNFNSGVRGGAFCCLIAGIIFGFGKKEEKMTASADSSVASFNSGASIGKDISTAGMIRFRLNVSDMSQIRAITIQVSPFKSCSLLFTEFNYLYTSNDGTAGINLDAFTQKNGQTYFDIKLSVNPQIEYQVVADIQKTNNTVDRIVSAVRSVVSVLEKMKAAGAPDYEQAEATYKTYMDSVIDSKPGDKSFRIIAGSTTLQPDGMVKASISLSSDVVDELKKKKTVAEEKQKSTLRRNRKSVSFFRIAEFRQVLSDIIRWTECKRNCRFIVGILREKLLRTTNYG